MKLPSLEQVLQEAGRTFVRFPFVLCNAAVGTVAAVILVNREGPLGATIFFNILFAAILGLPLLTAIAMTAEREKWSRQNSMLAQLVGVLLLVAYALTVPSDPQKAPEMHFFRLAILAVTLILFLAIAPYLRRGQLNGFWQYCRTLIFRFLTALLYASVLQAGLAIALAALDQLFGVDIPPKRYAELWFILVGIFGSWFFLSGMPDDLNRLDTAPDYPKGLKIFAQYILFPLVMVYFVILYAYLGKIVVEWNWPRGWVSGLILGFAVAGILTFLILYPIREKSENAWVRKTSRWFYIVMIPLVVVLFLAASRRISDYGITEPRYLLISLGVWLAALVVYFNLSSARSIKFIPASLCVIGFLVTFGPWSAFAVSENSQVARLKSLLETNSILVNSRIQKPSAKVSAEDSRQISSIISYLSANHGYEQIQPWFSEIILGDSSGRYLADQPPSGVTALLGVEYAASRQMSGGRWISFDADRSQGIDLAGYDRLLPAQYVDASTPKSVYEGAEIGYRVSADLDTLTVRVAHADSSADSVTLRLRPLLDSLVREYDSLTTSDIPPGRLSAEGESRNLKVKVCLRHVQAERRGDQLKLTSYQANILYSTRKQDE